MVLRTEAVTENVKRIVLDRPDSLNALDRELLSALVETISSANGAYEVLIVEGAGDAFTSGADLDESESGGDLFQEVTRAVRSFDGVVIGKLHGWVVGGGFEWTLSFDLCYAAEDTTFMMPESEIGVTITNAASLLLPLTVGSAKAKELIYTSREVSATEAEDLGLVAGVYEADRLEEEVLAVATDLVENKSSEALRLNKYVVNHALPVGDVMEQEELVNEYCHAVEDVDW
jgi:enoyl-CoA hydratase/carnithine racemase